jgi:hypothetical protein
LDKVTANTGLSLHEVKLDPRTRTLKGTIMNSTSTAYSKVQVSFVVYNNRGTIIGVMAASVPEVPANQTAPFETDGMPPAGREYDFRELVGVPQP